MIYYFLLLMMSFSLFSNEPPAVLPAEPSVEWSYRHFASVSYRRDRQSFRAPLLKEKMDGRNSMELILGSQISLEKLRLYLKGNYGWMINAENSIKQQDSRLQGPLFQGSFLSGSGYSADFLGTLGIEFPLVKQKQFTFSAIPSGGYLYSHLMNSLKGEKRFYLPFPQPNFSTATSGFTNLNNPDPNQQDWFGPLFEMRLECTGYEKVFFSLFYQYQFSSIRAKFQTASELVFLDAANAPTSIEKILTSNFYKASKVHKQVAGADLKFLSASGWNGGFHFEAGKAKSNKVKVCQKQTTEVLAPTKLSAQKTTNGRVGRVKWVCYEVSAFFGFLF